MSDRNLLDRRHDQDGFTLIELLVVMIIIGILAAIAIPTFLNQQRKAHTTAAKSDATNIAKNFATLEVDDFPVTVTLADATGPATVGISVVYADGTTDVALNKLGAGNMVHLTSYDAATGDYCVTVTPTNTASDAWSSGTKGTQRGTSCPA